MRHRRLTGSVLVLGACLPLAAGRLYGQSGDTPPASGQREVIAATVPATPEAPATLAPPIAYPPASPPGTIQPVSFVADPPDNAAAGRATASAAEAPAAAPMLPPTALLSGMTNRPGPKNTSAGETMAATLSVEVVGPDQLLVGKPLAHEIVLRNTGTQPIAEVHVEEPLPPGVRPLKADPPALARDNRLAWDLRHLEAGGERRLKVELEPGRPGELDLRPYVTFLSSNGLRTRVIRPPFSIEISADRAKATRGERIHFNIQLANHGDAPIRNIKIYDTLPSGLHHPRGPIIGIEHFGDLLPEQTRTIALETTAVESGTFHNEILAQADRGVEATAALDVVVTEPNLSLHVDGPAKTLTQREVDFHLEVANPAALTAKNIRLVQTLPPAFEVVSASTGASLDNNQHALVWTLPDLGAGQRQRVTFRLKANAAGDWPMSTAVLSQNFPEARVNGTLHAEAEAVLKWEVRVREDRLAVGEETVFRMHVFNKGDAPCTGLRLTATLPQSLTPFKAEGPSSEKIEQQQVRFEPLPQLDPQGNVVYRIHVRGRQAGKGSVRVQLTADKQTPADSEISVQVNAAEEKATAEEAAAGVAKSASAETLR